LYRRPGGLFMHLDCCIIPIYLICSSSEVSIMQRAEWLKKVRSMAETLYDHGASSYWVKFGKEIEPTHRQFLEKFLTLVRAAGTILDAACGAGLYDGRLLEAGHTVLGIDQSAGMLTRAREHYPHDQYPNLHFLKIGLQNMDFQAVFDGVICIDAMEHVCPEDWPVVVAGFNQALKPGGVIYVTVDVQESGDYGEAYERARAMGLPVIYGEEVDELDEAFAEVMEHDWVDPSWKVTGERLDNSVYHYHPSVQQTRDWLVQEGFTIEEEFRGTGYMEEYMHVLARKKA
jgi:2-polyprenyl-3-methyl-5-hydroxy-6-metoxy-1,4-benzoquinol methylase